MWTAFGIMLGYVADLAFYKVPDKPHIKGLNWRLMLASAGIPALFLMAQVFFCPESPRWLISKGRYPEAYRQQFCGVNVIAYYSSTIFTQAGFSEIRALLASWGFGALNFVMALPAVYTINTFGRRNLLLVTFPLMSLFLLMTGFAFWIPEGNGRLAVVALRIYLFDCVYSPGEGPAPFPYAAEAFPLYIRDVGMSLATAVNWLFNFVVGITSPRLLGAFKPQGAFGCTHTDLVFSVPTQTHAAYQIKALPHNIKKYIFRMKADPLPPLYEHDGAIGEKHYAPGGAGHA
ncbi:hypothetical protein EDB92DRAFT_1815530 [Lactarius akahatsu]|uniref:Uncharacterized protein n=1 Tax=Lactarius akahatsu TaxID=416441 RepID=A0AAD4LM58_9AGAM|nr:hypothetical protein EDB92DRAFT_1815530 [Lactarius akahatsu]